MDLQSHLEVGNLVKPEYFEFPHHQKIFLVVRDFYNKYKKLPENDFIIEECRKLKGKNEAVSDYVDELEFINRVEIDPVANRDYYFDLIENFAKKESLKNAIRECVDLINEGDVDAVEDKIKKSLSVHRNVDLGQEYFSSIKERWERTNNQEVNGDKFRTVIPECNDTLAGGHNRKELCIVAAVPGVGKSLYLANQAVVSLTEGRKVLFVTLEMSEDKVASRIDSVMSMIPIEALKNPSKQLLLRERIDMFVGEFPGAELVIKEFPTGTANVNTIRSLILQLQNHRDFTPDVIIIDYLELLRPLRNIEAEHLAQQRIAEEIRGLGMEYKALCWTATQVNREGAKVDVIMDIHLGDSYGKFRIADWMISLNQCGEEYDKGRMRVFVMKARDAKQKYLVPINIDYKTLKMSQPKKLEMECPI